MTQVDDQHREGRTGDAAESVAVPKPARILTPAFVLSWLVNFLQYLGFYVLVTTMAVYAVTEFAASDAESGLAASAFVIGATVARLFAGFVTDAVGRRRTMLAFLAVTAVACAFYLPAGSLGLLLVVRLVHGAAYAIASTATMALAQSAIPPARRAEGTGYFALSATLATAFGPFLGLTVSKSVGYAALFWTVLATALVALVLALFVRGPKGRRQEAEAAEKPARARFTLSGMLHPAVLPIASFMLVIGLCYAGIITYLNSYAGAKHLEAGASMFFVAYAVVMLAMRFFLGRLQDRRGDNAVVYVALVAFTLAMLALTFASADWHVIVAGALTGLGYGSLMPACQTIAVSSVDARHLGVAISTFFFMTDIGVGLGPVVLGLLVPATGFAGMYALLAAVVVAAAVLYFAVHGRREVARTSRVTA